MATTWPASTSNDTPRSTGMPAASSYAKLTSRKLMADRSGGKGSADGRSATSLRVSSSSKTRSAAAPACCRCALTRLSFLIGPYMYNRAATNAVKPPAVISPPSIRLIPYHSTPTTANAPSHSMSGGSTESVLVTFIVIR